MGQHFSEIISRQGELAPVDLPLLENGDHLTRCEFERRYQARPDIKKAELIERVVYIPTKMSGEDAVEMRNQTSARIIIRLDRIDAVAAN